MRRDLKNYRWEFFNKKITVIDKRVLDRSVVLDKIGFMSLARFILSAQDRLRLDDLKVIKGKINLLKEKYRKKHENHSTDSNKGRKQTKGTTCKTTPSPEETDMDTSVGV